MQIRHDFRKYFTNRIKTALPKKDAEEFISFQSETDRELILRMSTDWYGVPRKPVSRRKSHFASCRE